MNIQTILVPVDFTDVTPKVVSAAAALAQPFGAQIILLHVSEPEPDFVGFEPGPQAVRASVARDFRVEHQNLDALKQSFTDRGATVTALHIQGPMVDKILGEAEQHGAGLIVMGSHGHGAIYNLLVGSVTSGVLKGATCPVLVIPADRPKK